MARRVSTMRPSLIEKLYPLRDYDDPNIRKSKFGRQSAFRMSTLSHKIESGFPESSVHRLLRAFEDEEADKKFYDVRLLGHKRKIAKLLLPLGGKLLSPLNHLHLLLLVAQVICAIGMVIGFDFKGNPSVWPVSPIMEDILKTGILGVYRLPNYYTTLWYIRLAWYGVYASIIFVLLHMLLVLDSPPDKEINSSSDNGSVNEEEISMHSSLFLEDLTKSNRPHQMMSVLLVFFNSLLLAYNCYVVFVICAPYFVETRWRNNIKKWFIESLHNYASILTDPSHGDLEDTMPSEKIAIIRFINHVQMSLHCCGITNHFDWNNTSMGKGQTEEQQNNFDVPNSCLESMSFYQDFGILQSFSHHNNFQVKFHQKGCLTPMVGLILRFVLRPNFYFLLIITILMVPQLFLIIAALQPTELANQMRGMIDTLLLHRRNLKKMASRLQKRASQTVRAIKRQSMISRKSFRASLFKISQGR